MSRIAMNDIYAATFIVAAYALFWQIWSGRWARSAWWVLPLVGIVIGLAAATKWVGWYALIGLWVLVLARSHFGRFFLVAGIAFLTVVAGFGAPWPFLVVCILALALALFLVWRRPIQLSPQDILALPPIGVVGGGIGLAFAIAYTTVEGRSPRSAVEFIFAFLARGGAGRLARLDHADGGRPAAAGPGGALVAGSEQRPAAGTCPARWAGFAWPWVGACLLVLPLLIYFVAYIPYLELGHGDLDSAPGSGLRLVARRDAVADVRLPLRPAGRTPRGLTVVELAARPEAGLVLQPLVRQPRAWRSSTTAATRSSSGPVIPAILCCAVQAWRHRSLALVLVVAAFAFQYLPWTRIERATFHYHYFTAVLIAMIAVAYVVDEGLRSWAYRSLTIAFLVLALIAGLLIFPLGSALAMPDWYVNAARALAPWNYAFKFPDPPQGPRGQLLSADSFKLAIGVVVSLGAAAFALFGRD